MADYEIPASRTTTFEANVLQGVVGGIPSRSGGAVFNILDYGGEEGGGVATNDAAIAAALATSAEGDIVLIPAGIWTVNSPNVDGGTYSNRTIRGAGMSLTTLRVTGQTGFRFGIDTDWSNGGNPQSEVLSGLTAGSTSIVVDDGTNFVAGRLARITLVNEIETPIVSVYAFTGVRFFDTRVVSKVGDTLTIFPPVPCDFPVAATAGAVIEQQQYTLQAGMGLEDLTIDGAASGGAMISGVRFIQNRGCWIKGVKVINQQNYGINLEDCLNLQVCQSWVGAGFGVGTNRSALLHNTCSNSLVEDNVLIDNFPCIEVNFGSVASIFAGNYSPDETLNINHGPHNSCNLYEGNIFWFMQADGYFGGNSQDTMFRCWAKSGVTASLKRLTREFNLVGNIVGEPGETYPSDFTSLWGDPNIGNNDSEGTAEPSTGDWWIDWDEGGTDYTKTWTGNLTTRTNDTAGVVTLSAGQGTSFAVSLAQSATNIRGFTWASGFINFITVTDVTGDVVTFTTASGVLPASSTACTLTPSPDGFQEKDLDVANSALRKSNYYVFTGDIPAGESISPDTLRNSLYRSAKPALWGNLTWPAFNPNTPGTPADTDIPAGFFFANGVWPDEDPPADDTINVTTLNVTNLVIG